MATKTDNPLAPFTKLAPSVYIQEPTTTKSSGPLIFIAFWMNAPPRVLAKYVMEYRRMAPSAQIIFTRSSSNDFVWRITAQARRARVSPAVEVIRSHASPEKPVLLHMFSNGGVSKTTHMLEAYRQATGKALPITAMILDSAPGTADLNASMKAFSYALPRMWILRLISKGVLYFFLVFWKLVHFVTCRADPVRLARKVINDPFLVYPANAERVMRRCYIYSDADELVDWREVEKHADESEAKGWVVRMELFKGAPHVGHMRADPDRYWGIIKEYLGRVV